MMLGIQVLGRAVASKMVMFITNIDDLINTLNDPEEIRLLPINAGIKRNIQEWYSRANNKRFLEEVQKLHLDF